AASLIRDAEVENTIRIYATPLFGAAGLPARDVRIFIINDPSLNAFVAGGMNLFIHTGLLIKTKAPTELIGVIAHETGHIAGGHLTRFSDRIKTSNTAALVSTLLGALTAIATGSGGAGAAVIQGGQGLALGNLLSYSRTQESAADQAALSYLERTGQSARGLQNFLSTMENQEFLTANNQDPYMRTHPVTRDRLRTVEQHLKTSHFSSAQVPAKFEDMHRRMVAKLIAFIAQPLTVLRTYPANDTSIPSRYARAIAYYRYGALDKALPLIDGLIKDEPENPYFHELKGQMLFENGRIAESRAPNVEAARLAPEEPLLRLGLARSQLESNSPQLTKAAIKNLLLVTADDPEYPFAWEQLAVAYGRDGQLGLAALAQAEAALLRGRKKEALSHAERAEKRLKKGSTAWIRLQDIKRAASEKN
ncbi:MAG: putative Zn-dependent protease, partial [Alphaproteobacteria bacterium]